MTINKQILKNKNKKISPPFGYFGSKNRLAYKFCENLPPHECWIEAFCGSASITLRKEPAKIEIINDIDSEIINVFKQLRRNHKELCRLIELTPYSSEEFENARIVNFEDSDLERARKFLVQAMMAINGVFGKGRGGFSISNSYSRNNREARVNRWYNLPERLTHVVERLRGIRIENKDARKIIKKFANRPATLIYLDPPYLGERTLGYTIEANDEKFHIELLKLCDSAICMIFISGYDNDLYNSFLTIEKGWTKTVYDTFTNSAEGKNIERMEVVWMNKYYNKALKKGSLNLNFTEKEKKYGKVNPER